MRKQAMIGLAVGVVAAFGMAGNARADAGVGVIQPHLLAVYAPADLQDPPDRTQMVSKDPVAKVKKYYEGRLEAGDKIEELQNANEHGFKLTFYQAVDGQPQSVQLLQVTEKLPEEGPGAIIHPALGELKGLVQKGLHTEAEYQEMEKQYQNLNLAYYRRVDDGEGGTDDEGERIYRQAKDKAHGGEKFEVDQNELAAGKAKAKELKKQMKALKAKGDIAGMMKLAQQSKLAPPKGAQKAMDAAAKDTWDIWAACLRDLKAAAYWTKLEFHYGALPAE